MTPTPSSGLLPCPCKNCGHEKHGFCLVSEHPADGIGGGGVCGCETYLPHRAAGEMPEAIYEFLGAWSKGCGEEDNFNGNPDELIPAVRGLRAAVESLYPRAGQEE